MDRFNTNEEKEETPRMIAKDIIYSEGSFEEKVDQIESAILEAKKELVDDLISRMAGVAFVDRKFIEEWIDDNNPSPMGVKER